MRLNIRDMMSRKFDNDFPLKYLKIIGFLNSFILFGFSLFVFLKNTQSGVNLNWKFYCALGGLFLSTLIISTVLLGYLLVALRKAKSH
jgi:hypothetical protein